MSRHPYTNSCDFIRQFAKDGIECTLSRSNASSIRDAIADAIGMDRDVLAVKLSDRFMSQMNES